MLKREFIFDEIIYSNLINQSIKNFLDRGYKDKYKIAIFPYGSIGQLANRILNEVYSIEVDYIFDKELSNYNDNIKNIENLCRDELADTVVFICSDEKNIYGEIREIANKYFDSEKIFDVFTKVCQDNDVRIETLRLNSERINKLGIEGDVAEVGVYKGDFSKQINKFFKNRKLYMFDTFEGFKNKKVKDDTDDVWFSWMKQNNFYFENNNYLSVIDDFLYPEQCIVKKGYFPETTDGIDGTFCFVSLDVDIYKCTKDGLEFFGIG